MPEKPQISQPLGLETASSEWPKITPKQLGQKPIDRLLPGSDTHARVLKYVLGRLTMSEHFMNKFYARWQANERKIQAYVDLPDYEKLLKEQNDKGKPPQAIAITLPYSYATVATIVTYILHTFAGRKPMFQVNTHRKEAVEAARMMEIVLQFNSDHTRLIRHLNQFIQDGEMYGLGVMRTKFKTEKGLRTVWRKQQNFGFFNELISGSSQKVREERITYQGNDVTSIDPFMFFPDPRVPMAEVNRKGEFVFWRSFAGLFELRKGEAAGDYKHVSYISETKRNIREDLSYNLSNRHLLSRGDSTPGGSDFSHEGKKFDFIQIDQGTVEIIPAELGLSDSKRVEKWLFTIANKDQIIQAEPFEADHGMHPVCVAEPQTLGYGFGQPGTTDFLGPLQDVMSWFINSHIANVRTSLNNMFVVDPSMVEMQDLKHPGEGKLIRLKHAAYGQDVRQALQQLPVQDVTRAHTNDLEIFYRMSDSLSSVTDNIRGLQDAGGRKTATEVRTTGEAAASRLAAKSRLISAQGITDLTEQMSLNIQQYLEDEFYLTIVGEQGKEVPIHITPEMLVGDFYYPIQDGTLPMDKVAMLDVWKEIFMAVQGDQQLRQEYNIGKIFEWVAELGGAKNIGSFKINLMPDELMAQQAQAGNVVPLGAPGGGAGRPRPSGQVNAVPASPGDRLAGGL